jgi:hypothetical protein
MCSVDSEARPIQALVCHGISRRSPTAAYGRIADGHPPSHVAMGVPALVDEMTGLGGDHSAISFRPQGIGTRAGQTRRHRETQGARGGKVVVVAATQGEKRGQGGCANHATRCRPNATQLYGSLPPAVGLPSLPPGLVVCQQGES